MACCKSYPTSKKNKTHSIFLEDEPKSLCCKAFFNFLKKWVLGKAQKHCRQWQPAWGNNADHDIHFY